MSNLLSTTGNKAQNARVSVQEKAPRAGSISINKPQADEKSDQARKSIQERKSLSMDKQTEFQPQMINTSSVMRKSVAQEPQITQKPSRKSSRKSQKTQTTRKSHGARKSQLQLQKLSIIPKKASKPIFKSQSLSKSQSINKSQSISKSHTFIKSQIIKKTSFRLSENMSKSQTFSKLKAIARSKLFSKSRFSKSWLKYRTPCTFGLTERFNKIGFHPGLDKTGAMKMDILQLSPGQYTYDDRPVCMYKKYQKKSAWKRETECEEFSKSLGYRNAEILKRRIFMATHLGPGSHNISSEIFKKQDNNVCPDHGFGSQKKFQCVENLTPPPGTYFYNVKSKYDIRPAIKFSKEERFATKEKTWLLPPNRYEIKSSLRELLDKVVSKRGPYDLFSGDRGNNNTYNKLAMVNGCAPDKIYDLPSDLDYLLYDKQKRRTGKFFKACRFPRKPTVRMMLMDPAMCYKNPLFPGPDRYTLPGGIRIVPESMNSFFGTSKMEVRSGLPWTTMPGPGRYNVKYPKCSQGKTGSWVFKSKTKQRDNYKIETYNAF